MPRLPTDRERKTRHERIAQKKREKKERRREQHLRQKGEKKLIKNIIRFKAIGKDPLYQQYLWLRVLRQDVYSSMDSLAILRRSAPENVIKVRRWLSDRNQIAEALRWILRGLPVDMAIRKMIADTQERTLAEANVRTLHPLAPRRTGRYSSPVGRNVTATIHNYRDASQKYIVWSGQGLEWGRAVEPNSPRSYLDRSVLGLEKLQNGACAVGLGREKVLPFSASVLRWVNVPGH